MRSDNSEDDKGAKRSIYGGSVGVPGIGSMPKQAVIALLLIVALFAFEIFNFDTTRYALHSLLGDVNFAGLRWATILAIAFCAIDFAGLAHLFTPEKGLDEPKEVWYLMGAWLLGATMNAIMTWWAVSLTLLSHPFGNEVLGRETLLRVVPVFVAVLVWLTRILFIGAISVAGEHLFGRAAERAPVRRPVAQPQAPVASRAGAAHRPVRRPVRTPGPRPAPQPVGASGSPRRGASRPASMSGPRTRGGRS
jgi:hypothetical protein